MATLIKEVRLICVEQTDETNAYKYWNAQLFDGGKLMLWVKEAVPNAEPTSKVFVQLMNTITAQREGFKFRQKELLDMNRERNTILDQFPGSLLAMVCPGDHKKINVVIVTSTRTQDAFKTGKDDNVELFKK